MIDWGEYGWCPHCVCPPDIHHPSCSRHILNAEGISLVAGDLAMLTKPAGEGEMSTTRAVVQAAAGMVEHMPYRLVVPCPVCWIPEVEPCATCAHPQGLHTLQGKGCQFWISCNCVTYEPPTECIMGCRGRKVVREDLLRVAARELSSGGELEDLLREAFFAIDAAEREDQ